MKKTNPDELRSEYRREDLGKGVRGKHLKTYRAGTNLVRLNPEIAEAFPSDQSVNEALSSLIKVAQDAGLTKRSNGRSKPRR